MNSIQLLVVLSLIIPVVVIIVKNIRDEKRFGVKSHQERRGSGIDVYYVNQVPTTPPPPPAIRQY